MQRFLPFVLMRSAHAQVEQGTRWFDDFISDLLQ
jgi:hypothetical protein